MIPVSLLAVPIALAGNAIVMLGYVLQKKASEQFDPIEKTSLKQNIKNFLTSPIWLLGNLCTILSIPAALFAYAYGNIVLVNSLGGTGLIFLAIFSYLLLHEELSGKELGSYILLIAGIVISGIFSAQTVTQGSVEEFWTAFVYFYSLLFLGLLVVFGLLIGIVEFNKKMLINYKGITSTISAAIFMAVGLIAMKGWGIYFKHLTVESLRDIRFWLFAGINMSFSTLAMILMQFSYQRSKAIVVVPIYHTSVLLLPIIYGSLFLHEWSMLSTSSTIGLSSGLIIIALGIVSLTVAQAKQKEDKTTTNITKL